ncbi:unnamed protein product [Brassica oleracea var. botrytis]|uniref:Knottin scorpion toxin-like domain-containing protein n=1 Tax=Brassica oleracea var. oleracea TaxID=109376 RepID=A0A0D3E4C7_BRAOL
MTVSKTTLLIILVALLSCVCISNARELMKPGRYVQKCAGASCQPKLPQPNQYFGSCINNIDCKNSCFDSCKVKKCINFLCDCENC